MGTRGWLIFIVATIVLLGGLVVLSTQNRIDVSEFDAAKIVTANDKDGSTGDHVYGNKDAKVVLIEYGDYQCPGCKGAYERVKTVAERYKDNLAFVFRNLPLTQIHSNARAAAAVAEAAGKQGKYWEMHDKLYENQDAWSQASGAERSSLFEGYARDLALNTDRFNTDLASDSVDQKIRFDQAIFKKTGNQQSTPTFTMDGAKLADKDWSDEKALDAFIRSKLTAAGVTLTEETAEK